MNPILPPKIDIQECMRATWPNTKHRKNAVHITCKAGHKLPYSATTTKLIAEGKLQLQQCRYCPDHDLEPLEGSELDIYLKEGANNG